MTLERCSKERVEKEKGNIVDTVEERIQNAFLTALDRIMTPKTELAFRSINAASGRTATSVMANSERGEYIGISASFETVSERSITLHMFNTNDETRKITPDEVSELSVPGTQFDRQTRTHHRDCIILSAGVNQLFFAAPKMHNVNHDGLFKRTQSRCIHSIQHRRVIVHWLVTCKSIEDEITGFGDNYFSVKEEQCGS